MTSKPRRVCILVENLPSPFDRRVWQEARTLVEAGYVVSIICPTGKGYERHYDLEDGVNIYRYDLPHEASGAIGYVREYTVALWKSFWLACRVKRRHGFEIIQACNPPDLLFLVALPFKLLFGTKFVFDHHDLCPELFEAKFGKRGLLWRLMLVFERWTFRVADISVATNESYKEIAITRGGMRERDVSVVRSGPKLDRLRIKSAVARLRCGRRSLVGYVGVMGQQEGIDYLLQAIEHITRDLGREDVHFALVGGGTSLEEMKRLAERMGVQDFVTFTGRIPDEDLLDVLNTADVCVNPDVANTMNDKSTMNKIMEYMALGKPIVQFDLTEGRFSAQNASLYARRNDPIDFARKIIYLIDDPELRQSMGLYGRRRIENELEWRYEVPKLLTAYRSLDELPN